MPLNVFVVAWVFVAAIGVALYAISSSSLFPFVGLMSMPAVVYLLSRPEALLAVGVAISQSSLTAPGIPAGMNLFLVVSVMFVMLILIQPSLRRTFSHRATPVRKWVILFTVLVLVVMGYRGVGLRFFGSTLWGGAGYVSIVSAAALFVMADLVSVSPQFWKRIIITMCVLSLAPLAAQIVSILSGGSIQMQYNFIQRAGSALPGTELMDMTTNLTRLQSGTSFFLILLPLVAFARPFGSSSLFWTLLLFVGALVATGFSGFRSGLVICVAIPVAWLFFSGKELDWKRPLVLLVVMVCVIYGIALFVEHFPLSVQRTLSFLPFVEVNHVAYDEAAGTWSWRVEVWRRTIREVLPRYLWIGQGLAFNPRELQEIIALGIYDREWAYVTRSYHNGPISLCAIFGLPGLVAGLGFVFAGCREYYRHLKQEWSDPVLFRVYRTVFAWFVVMAFGFCVTYGDVQVSFPQLFLIAMLLEGIIKTQEALHLGKEAAVIVQSKAVRESCP